MKVYSLEFSATACTDMDMGACPGSKLRGAILSTLAQFCPQVVAGEVSEEHARTCPICRCFRSPQNESAPSPYALRWNGPARLHAGDPFCFEWRVIGQLSALPFFIAAVEQASQFGLGRHRQGRFSLRAIHALRPAGLGVSRFPIWSSDTQSVLHPTPFTLADVFREAQSACAPGLHTYRVQLVSPLRLIDDDRLVHGFQPAPFFERVVGRLRLLEQHYGAGTHIAAPTLPPPAVVQDDTRWSEAVGFNTHKNKRHPMSGLVGSVHLRADQGQWEQYLPLLSAGQQLGVGKNTVKGQGQFVLIPT